MTESPERITVSIPPTEDDLDLSVIDEAVAVSEFSTRSEFVRAALRGEVSLDLDQLRDQQDDDV